MYNVIRESITSPKEIIKYHRKKGWFVFLYILFFTLLISLDIFLLIIVNNQPTFNDTTTECQIIDATLVCDDSETRETTWNIYGIPIHLLSESQQIEDVNDDYYYISVQNQSITYRFGSGSFYQMSLAGFDNTTEMYRFIQTSILIPLIFATVIQNMLIIIFIILISTIPFIRFRKEIRYKKIFKMVAFAATPIYIILAINNLMDLNVIIFFILMFIGYRSIFTLQKEIYVRSMIKKQREYYQNKTSSHQEEDNDFTDEEDKD